MKYRAVLLRPCRSIRIRNYQQTFGNDIESLKAWGRAILNRPDTPEGSEIAFFRIVEQPVFRMQKLSADLSGHSTVTEKEQA